MVYRLCVCSLPPSLSLVPTRRWLLFSPYGWFLCPLRLGFWNPTRWLPVSCSLPRSCGGWYPAGCRSVSRPRTPCLALARLVSFSLRCPPFKLVCYSVSVPLCVCVFACLYRLSRSRWLPPCLYPGCATWLGALCSSSPGLLPSLARSLSFLCGTAVPVCSLATPLPLACPSAALPPSSYG